MTTSFLLVSSFHIFVIYSGISQVFGTLFIENTKIKLNPKYVTSLDVTYSNISDTTNITIHAQLIRKLNYKIMWKFDLTKFDSDSNNFDTKILDIPKINYCDVRRSGQIFPIISDLLTSLQRRGNLTALCPVQPGLLYLENIKISQQAMAKLFSYGRFKLVNKLTDENTRKPKTIYVMEICIQFIE